MTGRSSMRYSRLLVLAVILACGIVAEAQGPTYNLGRTPTEEELQPWDAAIGIDGKGLPWAKGRPRKVRRFTSRGVALGAMAPLGSKVRPRVW